MIELDGLKAGLDEQLAASQQSASGTTPERSSRRPRPTSGPCCEVPEDGRRRRRANQPSYIIQDGVVPRTRLPILSADHRIGAKHGIRIVNGRTPATATSTDPAVRRAGPRLVRRAAAGKELLEQCIARGGASRRSTGSVSKDGLMETLFGKENLEVMGRLRDALNPARSDWAGAASPDAPKILKRSGPARHCPDRSPPAAGRRGQPHPQTRFPSQPIMSNGFLPTTETVHAESAEMVAETVRRAGSQQSGGYPIGGATPGLRRRPRRPASAFRSPGSTGLPTTPRAT